MFFLKLIFIGIVFYVAAKIIKGLSISPRENRRIHSYTQHSRASSSQYEESFDNIHESKRTESKKEYSEFNRPKKDYQKENNRYYLDQNGYLRFRDSNMLYHRWVAEKKLGKKLRKGEVVHHINGIKTDNRPENLHVFANQAMHEEAHFDDLMNSKSRYSRSDHHTSDFMEFILPAGIDGAYRSMKRFVRFFRR